MSYTGKLKRVNGYDVLLRPGTYLMTWGNPDTDCKNDDGTLMVVVPMAEGEVMVVHLHNDEAGVYGCITWPTTDLDRLTDPMRVLGDIHNGDTGKRVSATGMPYYGTNQVCPACGTGRKNFDVVGDHDEELLCDCGWRGPKTEAQNPSW